MCHSARRRGEPRRPNAPSLCEHPLRNSTVLLLPLRRVTGTVPAVACNALAVGNRSRSSPIQANKRAPVRLLGSGDRLPPGGIGMPRKRLHNTLPQFGAVVVNMP
jgi:hypothetical protein